MKYRVPLKLTFDGFAIVEAIDEEDAEQIACHHMGADLGHVSTGYSDKIYDYEFDLHANVERRDNESIEHGGYNTIREILEDFGFCVDYDDNGDACYLSQYTPAGEDWNITLDCDEDIVQYAEDFDPEEEFEFWVKADCKGKPPIMELLDDQKWKKKLLDEVAEEVERFME